jgi:hypothetical protein
MLRYFVPDNFEEHGILACQVQETCELGTRMILLPMHTLIKRAAKQSQVHGSR